MPYMRDRLGRRLDKFSVLPRQVVSTRSNRLVSGRLTNDTSGRTYKMRHYFPYECGLIQLHYANSYAGGWGETPNTNPLIVRAALVKSDGTVFQATFNGDRTLYLPAHGQLSVPSAPTLTAGTAGNLTASATYYVAVTYRTAIGETTVSTATSVTVGASTPSITVTAPSPVANATGYRVYCSVAGASSSGPFYLVGESGFGGNVVIQNNPTTACQMAPNGNTAGTPNGSSAGHPALLVASDPIPADIAAGDYAYSVTFAGTPASGQFIPVGSNLWGSTTGEGNSGTDVTGNHASVAQNQTTAYSPTIITGITRNPAQPSVAIIGDSIPEGTGDPNLGPGDPGYVIRGLNNLYPYAWLAKGSELTTDFQNLSGSGKQRRVVRMRAAAFCNVSLGNYGTNDIGAGTSTAAVKANLLEIFAALKKLGHRVYWQTILPRTKSLDGWHTAGPGNGTTTGQFFYENTSWGAAGGALHAQEDVRQAINTWLRAPASAGAGASALYDADGDLDGVLDLAALLEVNSDGTAVTISPTTGALTGLGGGYWKAAGAAVLTGTATAGSTSTMTDSGKSWTTNQWSGYMLRITSGTAAGQVMQVLSNTATVLTLNGTITAPASGSGYELYQGYAQDGIHPAKPSHDLMAAAVTSWAAAL